jgi:ABC-type uncharacterized transport system permease subunit
MAYLKWILVLGLLVAGVFSTLTGFGIQVPLLKYKGLEGQNIPAGVVLIVAGICLAYFWKITIIEETSETISTAADGSTKSIKKTKISKRFMR